MTCCRLPQPSTRTSADNVYVRACASCWARTLVRAYVLVLKCFAAAGQGQLLTAVEVESAMRETQLYRNTGGNQHTQEYNEPLLV